MSELSPAQQLFNQIPGKKNSFSVSDSKKAKIRTKLGRINFLNYFMIQNPEDELKMQNREEFTQPPVEVKIALYKKYLIIDIPITSTGT